MANHRVLSYTVNSLRMSSGLHIKRVKRVIVQTNGDDASESAKKWSSNEDKQKQ